MKKTQKKVIKKVAKKERKKVIKTLSIDRSKWLAGPTGDSALLLSDQDNKMCCLGFLAKKCGLTDKEIKDKGSPESLDEDLAAKFPSWALKKKIFSESGYSSALEYIRNADVVSRMIDVNDDTSISNKLREAKLKRLFDSVGIKLTFTGKFDKEGPREF